jgi:hypothetical protein
LLPLFLFLCLSRSLSVSAAAATVLWHFRHIFLFCAAFKKMFVWKKNGPALLNYSRNTSTLFVPARSGAKSGA